MKRAAFYICLTALLVGLAPLLLALAGLGLARVLGCALSAAGPELCMVMGLDIGPTLSVMMVMHWFAILGLPLAGLGALGLLALGVIALIRKLRC